MVKQRFYVCIENHNPIEPKDVLFALRYARPSWGDVSASLAEQPQAPAQPDLRAALADLLASVAKCPSCKGTGGCRGITDGCPTCAGSGRVILDTSALFEAVREIEQMQGGGK